MKAAGIQIVEDTVKRNDMPNFRVGDTLKVHLKVKEGDKTRIQVFEGVCVGRRGTSVNASFAVIKETHGDVVEKTFPLYSPTIDKVEVSRTGKARRAKLYYMRGKKKV